MIQRTLLAACVVLAGCSKSETVIARLAERSAQVERLPREGDAWQPAKVGDSFVLGSAVRTGAASHAKLTVRGGGILDVAESSVVYFSRDPGKRTHAVRVEAGRVELESGEEAIGVGAAMLEPGGRARVARTADGVELVVTVGRALLEGGSPDGIGAGESVLLTPDGKVRVVAAAVPPDAGAPSPVDAAEVVAEVPPDEPPIGEAPAKVVVSIPAGESPVLHDQRAPTPVRIDLAERCKGRGTVEVAKDRAFKRVIARVAASGSANVLVPAGTSSYRVRCDGREAARGTIRIARDSGRAPLPRTAARTLVEMDGREYTILYQNLLPQLTLSWRNAPQRTRYTFVVQPAKGAAKRFPSSTPKLALPSGDLREGSYTAWVEHDRGARSEESRLVIEFDNAAASASIDAVDDAGGTFHIKGTVIEGSTVTAGGAGVTLDRHRRFVTEVAPGAADDGVSVRIVHPKLGVHYYVLRKSTM